MSDPKKSVIVIGGGLVGSLVAIFMAKQNYQVTIYEKREDIRKLKCAEGKSINLALSHRGRAALRSVGLEETILQFAIPMKGRFLHGANGDHKSVLYDSVSNQCIYSVGRNFLNQTLLTAAESYSNVKIKFQHKLIKCNFANKSIKLLNIETNEDMEDSADLIIGADGAFSSMRRAMQQTPLFEFNQTYIEHGYLELCVPQKRGDLMAANHLHIWPRGQFMMIALPNQDNSWTVTLFMPFAIFETLSDKAKLLDFFKSTFPDAVDLIGEEELLLDFFKSKPSSLVSIKCNPYNVGHNFMIIGDAAHAMVPFYGQGMNAGFEDCSIFNDLINGFNGDLGKSVEEFSKLRIEDAHGICDLAMYNYEEMRDLVTKLSFKMRKMFDDFLFKLFPAFWIPLYNSVSFSHMRYTECIRNRKWQDKVINQMLAISISAVVIAVSYAFYWVFS